MVGITFSVVSGIACCFLTYVLVQFNRELKRLRPVRLSSGTETNLSSAARKDPTLLTACMVAEEPQPELRLHRDMLVSGILGFVGIAAPFIFILLLNSSIFRR